MQTPPNLLKENAASLSLLILLIMAAMFARKYFLYQRTRIIFPPITPDQIRFDQRTASGRSFKTFFTRYAGANGCLHVTVTDKEVWVRMSFPFNVLAQQCDLEHRIPKTAITRLEPRQRFLYKIVQLEYRDQRGRRHELSLLVKNRETFLNAVGQIPPV